MRESLKLAPWNRAMAFAWIDRAIRAGGEGAWLTLEITDRRTSEQNRKLWPMLQDVATQVQWFEAFLSKEDWKVIFLEALTREMRPVPNISGDGFVNLGRSSSRLTKAEFADLIELIYAFGAEQGVVWTDPKDRQNSKPRIAA